MEKSTFIGQIYSAALIALFSFPEHRDWEQSVVSNLGRKNYM